MSKETAKKHGDQAARHYPPRSAFAGVDPAVSGRGPGPGQRLLKWPEGRHRLEINEAFSVVAPNCISSAFPRRSTSRRGHDRPRPGDPVDGTAILAAKGGCYDKSANA